MAPRWTGPRALRQRFNRKFRDHRSSPVVTPPGWRTGPPDFVGVGVQKAGTTWWYELLVSHPEIERVSGSRKELHFFDDYWGRPLAAADVARYHGHFPRPPGHRVGEWTPCYLFHHWAPSLLARAAPETRVLVILRDPIERYRSGLTHVVADGAPITVELAVEAYQRGFYSQQLRHLHASFPPEQVLVLQYERCRQDPRSQLARTFAFLGVAPDFVPDRLTRRANVTEVAKVELGPEVIDRLVAGYADDVATLPELVPDLDLNEWPSFADAGIASGSSARTNPG